MSFRRDLSTILAAHELDPDRCDLFVEGEEDRRVLLWLVGDERSDGAVVTAVEHIDVEVSAGGNRERVIELARRLEDEDVCILCFVDAGLSGMYPAEDKLGKLVLTDGPDLEAYVLQRSCVEKFLRLGLRTESWDSADLLDILLRRGRKIGVLRIVSKRRDLELPFRQTDVARHVDVSRGTNIALNERAFVGALLQNAGISLGLRDELLAECEVVDKDYSEQPDNALVHGKDIFRFLGEVARSEGRQRDEARSMLWTSLERRMVEGNEGLSHVLRFLENCCGAEPAST